MVFSLQPERNGLFPAPFLMGAGDLPRILAGRGIIDEMYLDLPATVRPRQHALHRLQRQRRRTVVVDDDRNAHKLLLTARFRHLR